MSEKPNNAVVQIRRKQVEKVVAERITHEAVHELRCEWVVLSAQKDIGDWEVFSLEVQSRAGLHYRPEVTVITRTRALMNVQKIEDRDKIISLAEVSLDDCLVSFATWSRGIDTLSSSWFQRRPRWITLVGIPYHLYSEETVKSLINRFGVIKRFSPVGPVLGGMSGSRVLIDNCDVRLIPHFFAFG